MTTKVGHLLGIIICILLLAQPVLAGQPKRKTPLRSQHDHPEIPRITAFSAKALFDRGKLILANAHESDGYARKHIIGSISLPNGKVQHMEIRLPRHVIIAFYCE